jgi:hypothetical protein
MDLHDEYVMHHLELKYEVILTAVPGRKFYTVDARSTFSKSNDKDVEVVSLVELLNSINLVDLIEVILAWQFLPSTISYR